MKNAALISATVALLVLSGCSSKEPAIDATASSASSTTGTSSTTDTAGKDSGAVIGSITDASATDTSASAGTNGSEGGLVNILFNYDKFDIREDMQEPMKNNSALLKGKNVKLEGNCDEFGSDEYNYALGLKRASTVKAALVNDGMNPESITMVSYGESNPVCLEKTPECWQQNRRVEFKLP
ncbi:MAG: OmpA family protein [Campylobacterales bacterium]|nr:OmpA family protein [Campylobacterales bacterium]